jgi:hypothetical protein
MILERLLAVTALLSVPGAKEPNPTHSVAEVKVKQKFWCHSVLTERLWSMGSGAGGSLQGRIRSPSPCGMNHGAGTLWRMPLPESPLCGSRSNPGIGTMSRSGLLLALSRHEYGARVNGSQSFAIERPTA